MTIDKATADKKPGDASRRSGAALEAMMQFLQWLIPTLDKLPRSQKFLLGDRMQGTALDVLERLIEATYSKAREQHLGAANLGIEKLRFLFRICAGPASNRPATMMMSEYPPSRAGSPRRR